MLDSRKLQIFIAVAEQQSFQRAAEQLFLAQSAVSVAIQKLETQLNVALFDRSRRRGRQTKLTLEGEALLQHARGIVQSIETAEREMMARQQLEVGTVRFSTTAMFGQAFFPDVISRFSQQYPHIQFQIQHNGSERVPTLLKSGDIDLGVLNLTHYEQPDAELEIIALSEIDIVVCVAKQHPWAKLTHITEAAFCQSPLVLYQQDYYLRHLAREIHQRQSSEPQVKVETDQLGMILAMVQANQGVTLALPSLVAQTEGVVGVPFAAPKSLQLAMAWLKARPLSLANQAFLGFLTDLDA